MPTVAEILKQTGMSDEQIAALDAKAVSAFGGVLTEAEKQRQAAELAQRTQADQYSSDIAPALDRWANEKAAMDAENAALKAALKAAEEGGFKVPAILSPTAAPATNPGNRTTDGRFVAGANVVPGSPQYMTKADTYSMVSASTWFVTEYMRLHNGQAPPDDIDVLANESAAQKIPFKDYVAQKYKFAERKAEIQAEAQKKHDDAIRAETTAEVEKKMAEKYSSNPDVRIATQSGFSTLEKAVKDGSRPDPIKQTTEQRRVATRNAIAKDRAELSVQ